MLFDKIDRLSFWLLEVLGQPGIRQYDQTESNQAEDEAPVCLLQLRMPSFKEVKGGLAIFGFVGDEPVGPAQIAGGSAGIAANDDTEHARQPGP